MRLLSRSTILLGGLGHRGLKHGFIVSSRLDELLIQLLEIILFLRVLSNQLDQLRPDAECLVVQLGNLLVLSGTNVARICA